MAVSIRLARQGTKKKPFYRVVVADSRSPRGGRFLENIGTFDPSKAMSAEALKIRIERVNYWRSSGAVLSDTLVRLLKAAAKARAASAK